MWSQDQRRWPRRSNNLKYWRTCLNSGGQIKHRERKTIPKYSCCCPPKAQFLFLLLTPKSTTNIIFLARCQTAWRITTWQLRPVYLPGFFKSNVVICYFDISSLERFRSGSRTQETEGRDLQIIWKVPTKKHRERLTWIILLSTARQYQDQVLQQ